MAYDFNTLGAILGLIIAIILIIKKEHHTISIHTPAQGVTCMLCM